MLIATLAGIAALLQPQAQPPEVIDPAALGPPSFYDDFKTTRICDPQLDPTCKGKHWLPDNGYRGVQPNSWTNRNGSEAAYVDPAFPGVKDGVLQPTPLGLNPFKITPGYLQISASPTPEAVKPLVWNKAFVSGLLNSRDLYTFTYGYAEVTADLPLCTRGAWPAIWTTVTDGWPKGGEDDFPEDIGTGKHWFSLHTPLNQATSGVHAISAPPSGCERGFHRYGALKTATNVAFYYDGRKVGQFSASPDMNRPHVVILNLAMGGPWVRSASGPPEPAETVSMRVRDVKVWSDR
jgi:hypothetical protein